MSNTMKAALLIHLVALSNAISIIPLNNHTALEEYFETLTPSDVKASSFLDEDTEEAGYISFNVNPYRFRMLKKRSVVGSLPLKNLNTLRTIYQLGHLHAVRKDRKTKRYFAPTENKHSYVSPFEMGRYPSYNVVKLSSGCTGTLLTPKHVLTAAHCVHDGFGFKNNMEMLKVEVPNKVGYRIHYILKINVPLKWLKLQFMPDLIRGAYDYAVIQLDLPVGGRDTFMQLALPTTRNINSNMQFLGFASGKETLLRRSQCYAKGHLILLGGNVALRNCESTTGNSGSAVYTSSAVGGDKIIGLLSNTISPKRGHTKHNGVSLEAISLLTMDKCLDICAMLYPFGEKNDVCETVKRKHDGYLRTGASRIRPFFG